ncbi:MAG: DUF4282 domain-containing protein [Armatimonadota bacterium]
MNSVKEFFTSLFDFSFKEFLIVKVVKVLYVIAIAAAFSNSLVIFLNATRLGFGRAFWMLIFSVLEFFVFVLLARAFLELIIVLFRIAENTDIIAGSARVKSPFNTELTAPVEIPSAPVVKTETVETVKTVEVDTGKVDEPEA